VSWQVMHQSAVGRWIVDGFPGPGKARSLLSKLFCSLERPAFLPGGSENYSKTWITERQTVCIRGHRLDLDGLVQSNNLCPLLPDEIRRERRV
jgi:hypothetical protein